MVKMCSFFSFQRYVYNYAFSFEAVNKLLLHVKFVVCQTINLIKRSLFPTTHYMGGVIMDRSNDLIVCFMKLKFYK